MAYEKFDDVEDTTSEKVEEKEEVKDADADADAPAEAAEGGKRKRKRKRKKKDKSKKAEDGGNGGDGSSTTTNNNKAESSEHSGNKLESLEHTIFVEGIPYEYKEDDVKEFFVKYGCDDILQMRLPTWQDTGRLRGFGHIVFDTTESRNKAVTELNGKNLGRRYITIQEPKGRGSGGGGGGGAGAGGKPREQPEGCCTVFVKNLPYRDITEDDVQEIFRSCGKIVEGGVRLTRNYQTKELKGFGYVEFKNPEGAYSAVQRAAKGTLKVGNRPCYVDYDAGRGPKGSFRNKDGKNWQKEHGDSNNPRDRKRFRAGY